ncbi:hypothetical protein P12x_005411 [Tundrisphaera lichenicola]|uniref:hypothetical protein n=1 Tax=Tundrisphaera lichenicola TaxID=2029860 RepID=UPI003EBFA59E
MKRFLASALVLSSFALFGLVGCDDTSTAKKTEEITTPEGSTKIESKTTVEKSGDNPPPVTAEPK